MRILALDLGEKNIGLAISDALGFTAQGLANLTRRSDEQVITEIREIVKQKEISEIVVGLPINMDGSLGKKAQEVNKFVIDLKKEINIPIKSWDERLTTMQAQRVLLEADLSRKKRRHKIDQLAAQLILQSYLDSKR